VTMSIPTEMVHGVRDTRTGRAFGGLRVGTRGLAVTGIVIVLAVSLFASGLTKEKHEAV